MQTWHISTKNGWIKVKSKEKPKRGKLVHKEEPKCLDWACGWAK